MNRIIFVIVAAVTLACGQAAAPPTNAPEVKAKTFLLATNSPSVAVALTPTANATYTVCNSGGLRLRQGAGTSAAEVAVIPDGAIVLAAGGEMVTPDNARWLYVRVLTLLDKAGWVNARYLCEAK